MEEVWEMSAARPWGAVEKTQQGTATKAGVVKGAKGKNPRLACRAVR